ncbi:MAG: integrase core domain-containing protein [Myxococcota bacterium]
MRTENGAPFASTGIHRLRVMSVSWIQLGITPERIEPSHPEQNGVHERMHRTLKAETTRPPAASLRGQQRVFDRFRHEYNEERPRSARRRDARKPLAALAAPVPERIAKPDYPGHFLVRLVSNSGCFRWHARQIFVSQALAQQWIGFEETDDGVWSVYFYDVLIARLDERTFKLSA